MLNESLQQLTDILNGRGFKVSFVNSDDEIKETGFYFFKRENVLGIEHLGIDHWSKAASNKFKVANEHGFYSDGFISMTDAEDIEVFLNRMQVWYEWLKRNNQL